MFSSVVNCHFWGSGDSKAGGDSKSKAGASGDSKAGGDSKSKCGASGEYEFLCAGIVECSNGYSMITTKEDCKSVVDSRAPEGFCEGCMGMDDTDILSGCVFDSDADALDINWNPAINEREVLTYFLRICKKCNTNIFLQQLREVSHLYKPNFFSRN